MRNRHAALIAVALVSVMLLSSCSLKEYNWWRDQAGLERIKATDPDAQWHLDVATDIWAAQRAEARRAEQRKATAATSSRIPSILWRIASCESGHGRSGGINYTARNPRSSASGGWQFLSGTWRYVARTYAGTWDALGFGHFRGEALSVSRMGHARPVVQQAAALVLYNREGTRPWNASRRCWS